MSATVAAGILANLASNAMADAKAETANENDRKNMFLQNMINRRNNVLAYSDQVQGAKMAGLNPAMLNGATPNVAAPVTKPNAHQAENVEIDPATLLLRAQKDNLDAQTEKTKAETAKIEGVDTEATRADIDLKTAQKLFTGANQAKVDEETKQIRNVNQAFTEENSAMGLFGQTTAQEWKKAPWYDKLPSGAKMVIDDIAQGNLDLTVGIVDALDRAVAVDAQMNKLHKDKVQYAFDTAILDAQFSDKSIMDAIAKAPKNEQEHLNASKNKIIAETERIKYKMHEFLDSELKGKNLSNEQLRAAIDAFKRNDLGYLKSQGEYGKWLEGYSEEMLMRLMPFATGGVLSGRMAGNAAGEAAKQAAESHGTKIRMDKQGRISRIELPDIRLDPKATTDYGVQSFKRGRHK